MFNTASIFSQVNPVYTLPPYLGVIRFDIIFSTRCMSTKWRLSLTFLTTNFYVLLFYPTPPTRLIPFHWISLIITVEEYKTWSS